MKNAAQLIGLSMMLTAGTALGDEAKFAKIPTLEAAASQGFFFAGGHYTGDAGKEVMDGAMYVEVFHPKKPTQRYPIVFFHGAAQTALNWLGTPDGRKGWAEFFLEQGYVVYLVDQPARGRSAYHPTIDGAMAAFPAAIIQKLFTDPEDLGSWAQAKKHTQWPGTGPGKGKAGDPTFDAFYATQVEFLASNATTQKLVQDAGAALLDRIGPAILVTHSQAGAFGWLLADARPKQVKGILAVEPLGPPFQDAVLAEGKARAWGPTDIPITYDPPIKDPSELSVEQQAAPDAADLSACWMQKAPVHKLKNLAGIPILVISGEASYHAVYDHCTAKFLSQAGATVDYQRLENHGIHGNGHMMMLEKNNLDIARYLAGWAEKHIK